MPKYIHDNQVIGAKGVNAFEKYCLEHEPVLVWREETKNDFGVDGEVEFTEKTKDGKTTVIGKIIKIQLKSTRLKGYIQNETDTTFQFKAKESDVDYWISHSCDVVLVVYFETSDELFARKITRDDLNKSKKTQPILFSKSENKIINKDNSFEKKFLSFFKQRVSYNHNEKLFSNLFKFYQLPKYVKIYNCIYSDPRDVFSSVERGVEIPPFVLKGKKLFLFTDLKHFPDFKEAVVIESAKVKTESSTYWITDKDNRRIFVQLLNSYMRNYCYSQGIRYSKEYGRYYFTLADNQEVRKERYTSKKGRDTTRVVAQKQEYYTPHVRHLAFQTDYVYNDETLYLVINPKYLFTLDGREPLEDKKLITKLTNYQTQRELNQSVINQIYFVFKYLSKNRATLYLSDYTDEMILIGQPKIFDVQFGIESDFSGSTNQGKLL